MKKLAMAMLVGASVLLAGCNPSQPTRTFADEDECEDAGMSDAFCDRLFPEVEDFFDKKKKPKPTLKITTKTKAKPSYSSRARVSRKK